jgi:16S rRNA (guanine966-N2)-methyltransferase
MLRSATTIGYRPLRVWWLMLVFVLLHLLTMDCLLRPSLRMDLKLVIQKRGRQKDMDWRTLKPKVRRQQPQLETAASPVLVTTDNVNDNDNDNVGKRRILPQGQARIPDRPNPDNLKILAGSKRGMRIASPQVYLRPMMSKVRAAVFSTLTFLGMFASNTTRCLDVFAGSGSVGLEALSRGAAHATFVDSAEDCVSTALRNAANMKLRAQTTGVCARAEEVFLHPARYGLIEPYQLVSVTPPYEEINYTDLLDQVCQSPLLTDNTVLVLEYPVQMGSLPFMIGNQQLLGLRNRRHGRTILGIFVNRPTGHFDFRPEEFCNEFVRKRRR